MQGRLRLARLRAAGESAVEQGTPAGRAAVVVRWEPGHAETAVHPDGEGHGQQLEAPHTKDLEAKSFEIAE